MRQSELARLTDMLGDMILKTRGLVIVVVLLAVGGALTGYFYLPSQKLHRLLGSRATKILSHPSRVEALRLGSASEVERADAANSARIGGRFPVVTSHIVAKTGFGDELADVLLDYKNYELDPNRTSTCIIDPALSFRIFSGDDFIDVLICFKCNQLEILDSSGRTVSHYDLNIGPGRPRFAMLAKQAFKGDRVIGGIE